MLWSFDWPIPGSFISDIAYLVGLLALMVAIFRSSQASVCLSLGWVAVATTLLLRFGMLVSSMSVQHALSEALVAATRIVCFTVTLPLAFTFCIYFIAIYRAWPRRKVLAVAAVMGGCLLLVLCAFAMSLLWGKTAYPDPSFHPWP